MVGENVFNFSFKKMDQVNVMGHKAAQAGGDALVIDPDLLLQWLLIIAKGTIDCDL